MITFSCYKHIELSYFLLGQLRQEKKNTSRFSAAQEQAPWVTPLIDAYRQSPRRMELHWLALKADSLQEFLQMLPDSELGQVFGRAVDSVYATWQQNWGLNGAQRIQDMNAAREKLVPMLTLLRNTLWEGSAPALEIIHSPSLKEGARALWQKNSRRIALDLSRPTQEALIQILHEECHPVSDPAVSGNNPQGRHSGELDTVGYGLQKALEVAAVSLGWHVIEQAMPELSDSYQQFCDKNGLSQQVVNA